MSGARLLQWIVITFSCFVFCGVNGASAIDTASTSGQHTTRSSVSHEKFRILGVFSHPGKSHFDVFRPLLEELAHRGHDLTVISYFPRSNKTRPLPNYRDINLAKEVSDVFVNVVDLSKIRQGATRTVEELLMLRGWGLKSCEYGLYNPEVQDLIKSDKKFDLIITEFFNSDCFLGFVHRFKVPFIGLSSHQLMPWTNDNLGNEDNPSYVPSVFLALGPKMTFFERVKNAIARTTITISYEVATNWPTQPIVEKVFGPGVPPLREIARNTSVTFVNTHFSLHGSWPHLPGIVEVGGIHISPNVKPLPIEFQRFLDEAHEGVLYLSLGSMIKAATMPKNKLAVVLNVIRSIPRKVIWKWEVDDMPDKPANLMVRKWLPQVPILRHPNVKCYMAHGGLLGLSEGVQAGIPMVIMPMFGDQFHNAAAAKSRGVAEVLDWNELSEETLRTALDRVFNDTRYGVNARALSRAYLDRPETPLETAVWWTEYVARGNGNPYLRSAAQDLTWYQYYLLDVILFLVAVAALVAYASYRVVRILLGLVKGRRNVVSVNGKNGSVRNMDKKTVKKE